VVRYTEASLVLVYLNWNFNFVFFFSSKAPLPITERAHERFWRQKTRHIWGLCTSMLYCIPQHYLNEAPTGCGSSINVCWFHFRYRMVYCNMKPTVSANERSNVKLFLGPAMSAGGGVHFHVYRDLPFTFQHRVRFNFGLSSFSNADDSSSNAHEYLCAVLVKSGLMISFSLISFAFCCRQHSNIILFFLMSGPSLLFELIY
jgi:hypothetical protein